MTVERVVLIWSFEHNAWWGPGAIGYVASAERAGRYTLANAERICLLANFDAINEAIVFLPENRNAADRPTGIPNDGRQS